MRTRVWSTHWAAGIVSGLATWVVSPSVAIAQETPPESFGDAYRGWKVVRADARSARDLQVLAALGAEALACSGAVVGRSEYALPPEGLDALTDAGIKAEVLVDDLEAAIEAERARIVASQQQRGGDWFTEYKSYEEYSIYLNQLVATRPDLASRFSVGRSLEDRDIFGIRITGPGGGEKPGIILHGLQHSREWVTGMTAMFIAERLVWDYDSNPDIRALVDHFEVFIIPVMNPDGYAYTWTPNNRLWRKNRRPNENGTFGVDLNRNWGYQWGALPQGGSSGTPSSETYRGTAPFSEPETTVMRDFITANPRMTFHVDIHSYGQLVLSPWGYTDAPPPDAPLFDAINAGFVSAIEAVHNSNYRGGPTFTTIYPANGVSQDWSYAERGVLGWGIECRDTGDNGFQLPANQIRANSQEVSAGIFWVAQWLRNNPIFVQIPDAPEEIPANTPATVRFEITRAGEVLDPKSVRAFARIGASGEFTELPIAPGAAPTEFIASLPPAACGETVQYYVQAASASGAVRTAPEGGAAQPLSALAVNEAVVFSDDVEADRGWTLGVPSDTASSGQWVRGDPNGTTAQPEDDHTPAPGTQCFFTGQGSVGGGAGQADVDGGRTTLISPPIDASQGLTTISYWRWYSNALGAAPRTDVFTVDVSGDDGATWTRAETVGPSGPETDPAWFYHELVVSDFVTPSAQTRVRFVADDAGSGSLVEAALDDISVRSSAPCPPPVCAADWDASGTVNSQDFFDFLADFFMGDADINNTGATDSQDFFDFLTLFFEGC